MKAPFLWIGVSFAFGIIAWRSGLCLPWAPGLVAALLAGVMLWFCRGTRIFFPLFLLLMGAAGFFRAEIDAVRHSDGIERFIGPGRLTVRGIVQNQPDVRTRGKRVTASFLLDAQSVRGAYRRAGAREKKTSGRVQVFWIQPGVIPESGDAVELSGRLDRPRPALNPGQFDHEKYLAGKKIFTVLQPIGPRSGRLVDRSPPWNAGRWIGRARTGIVALLGRIYPFPQSELLKALVVGARSNVPADLQGAFMKTGTVHLVTTTNTKWDYTAFSNAIAAAHSP